MSPTIAIGIVRVSSTRDRDETIKSPKEQANRLQKECAARGLKLLRVVEELDVSGGTPLAKRRGLREAVEAIEAGEATVIVAAYFDRLMRSLKVQAELVERVEAAGGQVLALDTGQVTNGSAGQWLSSTMLGMVAEYQRRTTAERVSASHRESVAAGIPPYPFSTPGYVQRKDRTVMVADSAPVVARAFGLRTAGATIADVRAHLNDGGVVLSYRATQTLLKSRAVLGELRSGKFENLQAWDPIVDRDVWEAVQRVRVPQGRKPKTERLLARLGKLICGSCGRPMVSGSSVASGTKYFNYRCSLSDHDCPDRQVISARIVEGVVERAVRGALADAEGRASALATARMDAMAAEHAQEALDAATRVALAAGITDEGVAAGELSRLREARDGARRRASRSAAAAGSTSISVGADWDALTIADRRALVRAIIDRIVVSPGRGVDRIAVELVR